jgi:hypothetical protein
MSLVVLSSICYTGRLCFKRHEAAFRLANCTELQLGMGDIVKVQPVQQNPNGSGALLGRTDWERVAAPQVVTSGTVDSGGRSSDLPFTHSTVPDGILRSTVPIPMPQVGSAACA